MSCVALGAVGILEALWVLVGGVVTVAGAVTGVGVIDQDKNVLFVSASQGELASLLRTRPPVMTSVRRRPAVSPLYPRMSVMTSVL